MLVGRAYIRGEFTIKSETMNPYQVMGIIACCTIVFAGVVTLLTMQGVNILQAFLGVYLFAVWCMLGMQRRARESYEARRDFGSRRRRERDPWIGRIRAKDCHTPEQGRSVNADRVGIYAGDVQ